MDYWQQRIHQGGAVTVICFMSFTVGYARSKSSSTTNGENCTTDVDRKIILMRD